MLVYLISTGQNVANVLPVLEFAGAGDTLIWLESSRARSAGWTEGAIQVLKSRGFGNQIRLEVGDSSENLARTAAELASGRSEPIAIVANGGTKLQSLALYGALAQYSPKVLYNDDRSACYLIFDRGPTAAFERRPYQKTAIGLDEILACRGFAREAGSGMRIWPGAAVPSKGGYGYDPAVTAEKHRSVAAWYAESEQDLPPMTWNLVEQLLPGRAGGIRTMLENEVRSAYKKRSIRPDGVTFNSEFLPGIFAAFTGLAGEARKAWIHQDRTPSSESLGLLFEQAVAMRVLDWLATSPVRSALAEIWSNVKVLGSERVIAELDIAFVMKNGVLLHLECKSFKADSKDLYARLFNLQNGTSRLAEMAVCAPLYTEFTDEPWFKDMHKMKAHIEGVTGFHFIPFTLPDQPTGYSWLQESIRVPSFEESLDRWLGRFIQA